MTARGLWLACFCTKNAIEEWGSVLWSPNEYTVKYLMVSFYSQFSVFWAPVCSRENVGWVRVKSNIILRGFKALPILCITVLKPSWAVNEHTALGVCCFEWLVDMWNCPCKEEFLTWASVSCWYIQIHNFYGNEKIICAPRVGDE